MSSKRSAKKPAAKRTVPKGKVVFLNPRTCGLNKDGDVRYKVDFVTSRRTAEVDNEMLEQVEAYLSGQMPDGIRVEDITTVYRRGILVPQYYDRRFDKEFSELLERESLKSISIGELVERGIITVREGHGSPSSDFRSGQIPYVKVSDIRSLRVNVNPTNMVPLTLAKKFWRGADSGLKEWDLITPNRASSNIGEFAIILPGEEQIVVTKEVFILRVKENEEGWDPFYLLWALSLRAVRQQWRRVTLMQTNREDVAARYREIELPAPKNKEWAEEVSLSFRNYFITLASAKHEFVEAVRSAPFKFIPNIATEKASEAFAANETDGTDVGDVSDGHIETLFDVEPDRSSGVVTE